MSNNRSDTQKRVQSLSAGWRDQVADAMGLDRESFQFAQGSLGLQTSDSSGLWRMADSVPPESAVHYFDAGGLQKWSSAYGSLLFAIQPESGSDLRDALGDSYSAWNTYALKKGSRGFKVFREWAQENLNPMKVVRALAVYIKALNTPWSRASEAYMDPNNQQEFAGPDDKKYSLYRYSIDIDDARNALKSGKACKIDFQIKSEEGSSTGNKIEGFADGMWDIFAGAASGEFESLNTKASGAGFTISGEIQQYATLPVRPGQWLDPEEVHRGYASKDNYEIWDPNANAGDWETFFGPDGSLARRVAQMVLVSGYKITVTSQAEYSEDDVTKIKANAVVGVWPFFSGEISGSRETTVELNNSSRLEMTHTLDLGKIQIWGVTVKETL